VPEAAPPRLLFSFLSGTINPTQRSEKHSENPNNRMKAFSRIMSRSSAADALWIWHIPGRQMKRLGRQFYRAATWRCLAPICNLQCFSQNPVSTPCFRFVRTHPIKRCSVATCRSSCRFANSYFFFLSNTPFENVFSTRGIATSTSTRAQ
jgi:hypothetical protein